LHPIQYDSLYKEQFHTAAQNLFEKLASGKHTLKNFSWSELFDSTKSKQTCLLFVAIDLILPESVETLLRTDKSVLENVSTRWDLMHRALLSVSSQGITDKDPQMPSVLKIIELLVNHTLLKTNHQDLNDIKNLNNLLLLGVGTGSARVFLTLLMQLSTFNKKNQITIDMKPVLKEALLEYQFNFQMLKILIQADKKIDIFWENEETSVFDCLYLGFSTNPQKNQSEQQENHKKMLEFILEYAKKTAKTDEQLSTFLTRPAQSADSKEKNNYPFYRGGTPLELALHYGLYQDFELYRPYAELWNSEKLTKLLEVAVLSPYHDLKDKCLEEFFRILKSLSLRISPLTKELSLELLIALIKQKRFQIIELLIKENVFDFNFDIQGHSQVYHQLLTDISKEKNPYDAWGCIDLGL